MIRAMQQWLASLLGSVVKLPLYVVRIAVLCCGLISTVVLAAPTYRFGINAEHPPFSFVTKDGLEGLAYEMATEIFQVAGIEAEIIPLNWSVAQSRVQAGSLDGIIHINRTAERDQWLIYSGAFLPASFHVFARPGLQMVYTSPEDLRPFRLALETKGYPYNLLKDVDGQKIMTFANQHDALEAVSRGEADVFIGETVMVEYMLRELGLPDLLYMPEPFQQSVSRIGVSRDHPELVVKINEALVKTHASGDYQSIYAKWNSKAVDHRGRQQRTEMLAAFLVGLSLVFAVALWRERNFRITLGKTRLQKDQFLANVTHQLRTPLNTIYGNLSKIITTDESTRLALNEIKVASRQLTSLTDNLHYWERHCLGRLTPEIDVYSIHFLLDQLQGIYQHRQKASGVGFYLKVKEDVPDMVVLDWSMLGKLLSNLLDNAFRHCSSGFVKLNVFTKNDTLHFKVSDTGSGIDAEKLLHLIRVYQDQGCEPGLFGDTAPGLGLAVSQALAAAMGGKFSINSVPDLGTEVMISVPLVLPSQDQIKVFQREHGSVPDTVAYPLKGSRILLVDDHESNLSINAYILESLGASIVCALDRKSAQEAVDKSIHDHSLFDVIFMDLQMPGLDGFDSMRLLRERHPGVELQFVALTACDHDTLHEELASAGVNHLLHKPFEVEDAVRVVRQIRLKTDQMAAKLLSRISANTRE